MKIFATISFGENQVTQAWQFLNVEPFPLLILMPLNDGTQVALKLEKELVKEQTGLELAEKTYFGSLNVSDAVILKPIESNDETMGQDPA
jgi:hypothetical protein